MTDAAIGSEVPQFAGAAKIIYDRMPKDGTDVSIASLYCAAFGVAYRDIPANKTCQMALGSYISAVNKKLARSTGERIVPGRVKRTYRLDRA